MMQKLFNKRGQALTEFVVLIPVLIILTYLLISLNDIGLGRIKADQIARYSIFAFADTPTSNYRMTSQMANHGTSSYPLYKLKVKQQVYDIWHDMDPTTTMDTLREWIGLIHETDNNRTFEFIQNENDFEDNQAPILYTDGGRLLDEFGATLSSEADEKLREALNKIQGAYSMVLEHVNMNTYGLVTAKATVRVHNNLADMPFLGNFFPNHIDITRSMTMLVDSWKLEDGRDVHLSHQSKIEENSSNVRKIEEDFLSDQLELINSTAFHGQIKKMWLAGFDPATQVEEAVKNAFGDKNIAKEAMGEGFGKAAGAVVDFALGVIPARPFDTRVSSHGYRTDDYKSGMVDVFKLNNGSSYNSSERTFHTIPMEDGGTLDNSEYYKTFKKRGDFFMGCKKASTRQCNFDE